MAGLRSFAVALALVAAAQPGSSATPAQPTRLFASGEPIRLTLRGPIGSILSTPAAQRTARPASLALTHPAAETHAILLSPRGLTRRKRETCDFPPLRVEFTARPAPASLFERQKRVKLVTHCRKDTGFQQHVLVEYAAYRLLGAMSPHALKVRLAQVDYVGADGRPMLSRLGFFIEDPDDAARRNGLEEVRTLGVAPSQLDPREAARAAMFQYMIGNLDWSMRSGPPGDDCCHNFKLMGASEQARTGLIPVPYDFDFSGLVNAPYATPPDVVPVSSVRVRRYRGHCIHNAQALGLARELRGRRAELLGVFGQVPQLDERRRSAAVAYLAGFFRDIATDEDVQKRLLRTCLR
jgi:hypothetical protein